MPPCRSGFCCLLPSDLDEVMFPVACLACRLPGSVSLPWLDSQTCQAAKQAKLEYSDGVCGLSMIHLASSDLPDGETQRHSRSSTLSRLHHRRRPGHTIVTMYGALRDQLGERSVAWLAWICRPAPVPRQDPTRPAPEATPHPE